MKRRWKSIALSTVLLLGVVNAGPARAPEAGSEAADPARTATLITADRVTLLGSGGVSVKAAAPPWATWSSRTSPRPAAAPPSPSPSGTIPAGGTARAKVTAAPMPSVPDGA
ncbi:hypothetical protein ACQPZJ_18165 [Actinoplanes sp. CA-054009]